MTAPDLTPCYAAYCTACGGMVAVVVADVAEPEQLQHALRHRRDWERAGLRIGNVTCADIHNGAMTGHLACCPNDKAAKRELQRMKPANRELLA